MRAKDTISAETQRLVAVVIVGLAMGCGHLANGTQVEDSSATTAPPAATEPVLAPDCADGVVKDDGTVETGYGFVPSATEGIYVQRFSADEIAAGVDQVCLCFLKKHLPRDIGFDVVFYESVAGRPAEQPFAAVPAAAAELAASVPEAGAFTAVDVTSVQLPAGDVFVGARWDPSVSSFLFLCTDTSEPTVKTEVFFREDRARGWTSVAEARDPIFLPHRAVLVRLGRAGGG